MKNTIVIIVSIFEVTYFPRKWDVLTFLQVFYFHAENQIIHPAHIHFILVSKNEINDDSKKKEGRIEFLNTFQKQFFTDTQKKVFTETKKTEKISLKMKEQVFSAGTLGIIDLLELMNRDKEIPSNKQQRRTSIMKQKKNSKEKLYNCFECEKSFSISGKKRLLRHYYDTKVWNI